MWGWNQTEAISGNTALLKEDPGFINNHLIRNCLKADLAKGTDFSNIHDLPVD
jgi:hypothetical protein